MSTIDINKLIFYYLSFYSLYKINEYNIVEILKEIESKKIRI